MIPEPLTQISQIDWPSLHPLFTEKNLHRESYLSQAAFWYAALDEWLQIILMAAIITITTLLSGSILIGILTLIIYSGLTMLFWDHHLACQERDERLSLEIQALETSLQGSVAHLNTLQEELTKVFTSLSEMNQRYAEEIVVFERQITELSTSNEELKTLVAKFDRIETTLSDSIKGLPAFAKTNEHTEQLKILTDLIRQISTLLHELRPEAGQPKEQPAKSGICEEARSMMRSIMFSSPKKSSPASEEKATTLTY